VRNAQEIGMCIEKLIKERGENVKEALTNSGVGRMLVDSLKKGSMPSADKLYLVANYLGVSTDYLLKGEEPQSRSKNEKGMVFMDNDKELVDMTKDMTIKERLQFATEMFDRGIFSANDVRKVMGLPLEDDKHSDFRYIHKDYVEATVATTPVPEANTGA